VPDDPDSGLAVAWTSLDGIAITVSVSRVFGVTIRTVDRGENNASKPDTGIETSAG
jgi:hypothetical protein